MIVKLLALQVEIKKAVFVEPGHSADDEGVSLSATPASEDKAEVAVTSSNEKVKGDPIFATVVMKVIEEKRAQSQLESKQSQQGQPRGRSNNPHDSGEMLCFFSFKSAVYTLCKWAFTNYIDNILPIIEHLITPC